MARVPLADRFEQRKATRKKLVDAALQLFSTSGYDRATVDDISEAAGYSKGAYYFHFSTKDDILYELLRIWTEDRSAVLATAEAEGTSPRNTLASFFSYAATPQWPGVLIEFWANAVRNPEMSKRLSGAYAGWRKQIGGMFERAAESGALNVASTQDAAAVSLAAHDGLAVQTAIGSPGGKAMTPAQLADSILAPMLAPVEVAQRRAIAR